MSIAAIIILKNNAPTTNGKNCLTVKTFANTKIPIVDVDTLKDSDVDIMIIFDWNYSKMIIEKTQFKKYSYLVAFPNVQLVDSYDDLKGFDSI